ncbi:hypothetical protein [Desulfallas thermosapovorans]|uniref:hypothetical protein n=1 Tax=Desulfallas thermosapovorans TaxID=58137 RepID=UPI0014135330|nr:hypothetical protein [Desulfallas thermosapovorans]
MEYLGDYRVGFEDWKTGLKHTILLDESMYKGNEALLENIDTWVDPISEYKVVDKDNNGVCEVTSIQRVTGIAHVDTIARLQTTYRMGRGYQPSTITLVDINGKVLAEKKI